ncbi:MAG: glycosyltransferase family 4 protein [Lentisphaeria bacterium]|nr:glycosyltransferase family 4 protein [Lentisphaeria bacterium]
MDKKHLKIFISAYACEPEKGSEPGIGWNTVNELSMYHEVHVLTRANNRESIEKALSGRENPNLVFHYYDVPKWLSFWKKKRRGYHFYYYLWQYGAYFKYRNFVNTSGFDIVQHLTFANFAMPSLFMLCKPLTVWGPIGYIPIPKPVFKSLPFKIRLKEILRKYFMSFLCHFELLRLLTPRKADFIMESGVASGESSFPSNWQKKIIHQPQTGINTSEPEYQTERKREDDGKVRLLICSEFLHWKGVTFSCEVFSRIAKTNQNVELHIYGSGPLKKQMATILKKNGVSDRVSWKGFVSKREMIQALFDADILLYPSYHHGLATVILQAMYAKLPIITIAGDPIALAVSEGAGTVSSGETMTEVLDDMEQKTRAMIESAELRHLYGENGRRLIEKKYEWNILIGQLSEHLINIISR